MSDTITIHDPELAKMFESAAPTMGDIPRAVWLGPAPGGGSGCARNSRPAYLTGPIRAATSHPPACPGRGRRGSYSSAK